MTETYQDLFRLADGVIGQLPLGPGGLTAVMHHAGAFSGQLNPEDLPEMFDAIRRAGPTQGNGPVWYLDDEHHGTGEFSEESFYAEVALPLPGWAQRLQRHMLSRLCVDSMYGWSAVLFWASTAGATVNEHVDNEDVYTVQLCGEKRWLIDRPSLSRLSGLVAEGAMARLNPSESWVRNQPAPVEFDDPLDITMRPGDFLAMPALSLHHVETITTGPNVSFNVSICQEKDWAAFASGRPELKDVGEPPGHEGPHAG